MVKEIDLNKIDTVTALPVFRKRLGYYNDEANDCIEIYYVEYQKTPTGQVCFYSNEQTLYIRNIPAVMGKNEAGEDITITPATTSYTDYFNQFGGEQIGTAIDSHLKIM